MSNSLRDQLLGLGYKPAPKPERAGEPSPPRREAAQAAGAVRAKPIACAAAAATAQAAPANPPQEEIDLGKAYALRAQKEKDDRIEAERLKQEEARMRREAKAKLAELLKDKALNDPAAEIARHFEYGGKIKRIHVTAEQLTALNAGELGVVADGRSLPAGSRSRCCWRPRRSSRRRSR